MSQIKEDAELLIWYMVTDLWPCSVIWSVQSVELSLFRVKPRVNKDSFVELVIRLRAKSYG